MAGGERVMETEVRARKTGFFTYAGISLVSWLANKTKNTKVVEDREKERKEGGREKREQQRVSRLPKGLWKNRLFSGVSKGQDSP